jgi:hypothetical protein
MIGIKEAAIIVAVVIAGIYFARREGTQVRRAKRSRMGRHAFEPNGREGFGPLSYDHLPQRIRWVEEHIQGVGSESFPDNNVEWRVIEIEHRAQFTLVKTMPYPNSVGYDRFVFVFVFNPDHTDAQLKAVYAKHSGTYGLLFTSDAGEYPEQL